MYRKKRRRTRRTSGAGLASLASGTISITLISFLILGSLIFPILFPHPPGTADRCRLSCRSTLEQRRFRIILLGH